MPLSLAGVFEAEELHELNRGQRNGLSSRGGGEEKLFDTGWYIFSGGDPPPPLGGGGTKKSGSYRKNVFFPCRTYHT